MKKIITKKERRTITDRKILTSSITEFGENGYVNTTIAKIAQRAKVAPSLVIQNFHSKQSLFIKIVEILLKKFNDYFEDKNGNWEYLLNEALNYLKQSLKADKNSILPLKFYNTMIHIKVHRTKALEYIFQSFEENKIYLAMIEGQKNGEIKEGNMAILFRLYYQTVNQVISTCIAENIVPPENEWFIGMLRSKNQ